MEIDTDQGYKPPSKNKTDFILLKDKIIIQKTIIKEKPSHGNLVYDILETSTMKKNTKIQQIILKSTINHFKDMIQESQQNIENKN